MHGLDVNIYGSIDGSTDDAGTSNLRSRTDTASPDCARLGVATGLGSGARKTRGPSVPPALRMSMKNMKKISCLDLFSAIRLNEGTFSSPAAAQSCLHTLGASDALHTGMAVGSHPTSPKLAKSLVGSWPLLVMWFGSAIEVYIDVYV